MKLNLEFADYGSGDGDNGEEVSSEVRQTVGALAPPLRSHVKTTRNQGGTPQILPLPVAFRRVP